MKRRLLIAKALSHNPKILFLDEPTASVDVELRRDMWKVVDELRKIKSENSEDEKDNERPETLREAFDQWYLEGAVLTEKSMSKAIYRSLSEDEINKLKSSTG